MNSRYSAWARLLCLTATLSTAACTSPQDPLVRQQFFAFGTLVEVSLYEVQQPLADQALAAAEADFQRMHQQWHAWHSSELTNVNRRIAAGKLATVPPELLNLITEAKRLSLLSNGLFNPAIGRLVRLWGFQQDSFSTTQPPDPKIVYDLLSKRPGMEDLTLDDGTIFSRNPAVQFDLGAVAKGFGIDRVIEHLQSLGVRNAIVNCGGDLRAIGRHGTRPWRIGIRSPRGAGVLASLELSEDESVFTSGDYERFFESGGKRYHHILDPRTGYPAQDVISVTVVHHDATTADAAATALFVAGPDDWSSVARRMGVKYVMLVDRLGTVHMNPAMAERVQFEVDPLPQQEISKSL